MAEKTIDRTIESDLDQLSSLLGMPVCLHDRTGFLRLKTAFRIHNHRFCRDFKAHSESICVAFDMGELHRRYGSCQKVMEIVCPAGYHQWIRPLTVNGIPAGLLFAGPTDEGKGELPEELLPLMDWCAARIEVRLGKAITRGDDTRSIPFVRKQRLIRYIEENLKDDISLAGGADSVALSPSRLSHVMADLFDCSFPELVNRVRLGRGASLLEETDLSVSEIAALVGYADPDYFSRLFRERFGESALRYRKRLKEKEPPWGGA